MIKVEYTNKTFSGKYGEVHALQDVSIHVEKGDIYGIIFTGDIQAVKDAIDF